MERLQPRPLTPIDTARIDEVDRMATPALAQELVKMLGAKLTAAAGGVNATRLVREWIEQKHQPSRKTALATALKAARIIADRDGDIVAQRWFVGTNEFFDHRSPIEVATSPGGAAFSKQA